MKLLKIVCRDLLDVVKVCEGKMKQTNYLRSLINDLVKGSKHVMHNNCTVLNYCCNLYSVLLYIISVYMYVCMHTLHVLHIPFTTVCVHMQCLQICNMCIFTLSCTSNYFFYCDGLQGSFLSRGSATLFLLV